MTCNVPERFLMPQSSTDLPILEGDGAGEDVVAEVSLGLLRAGDFCC
jgi:hypothetical protein